VPPVPASLVARIRALPQVSAAQGFIDDKAEIRNAKGAAITGPGTPLAFGAPSQSNALDPVSVVAGHRPSGPGQIALDPQTAKTNHFSVGSTVGIVSRHPLEWFRVVGLVRFGGVSSLGPLQMLVFDLPTAQRLFDKQGLYDEIFVAARHGVSHRQLMLAIAPLLPASAQVKTGCPAGQGEHRQRRPGDGARPLRAAGVRRDRAVRRLVCDLQHAVGDRRPAHAGPGDFAHTRRLPAPGARLGRAGGVVIGVAASLIGLLAGLGLAKALASMFASMGMQLPNAGTVLATRTVIVSLAAGIAVTLLASLAPALRATRVAPIAAIREGAQLPPGRLARTRTPVLAAVALLGAGALASGLFASGLGTAIRLVLLACGAAFLFVGVAFAARWLIGPLSNLVGRPLEAISGTPGMLARENTARNPARTAVTAGALTVGLALVAFVATLGAGLRGSINDAAHQHSKPTT
jgi:putative ABC transport system permease protein